MRGRHGYADPTVAPPVVTGNGLEVLDAELVAIDGVPVTPGAPWRRIPRASQPEPLVDLAPYRWWHPGDNPVLYAKTALALIPAAIVGVVLWLVVRAVSWVTAGVAQHATGIEAAAGGGLAGWLLLALLGGGGGAVVCAGLHCAGCRR